MSPPTGSLHAAPVAETLDRLHADARGDWKRVWRILPHALWSLLSGRSFMKMVSPARLKTAYLPVSRAEGEFLYLTARAIGARRVVEFGSSFGISTIYLGAAVRDNGGGRVISTEIEPSKCLAARANLRAAGLHDVAEVWEGDARETLAGLDDTVDLLFLDGWKDLYLPILELMRRRLRPGALVIADNVNFADSRPYVQFVRAPQNGFLSSTLFSGSLELSCLVA